MVAMLPDHVVREIRSSKIGRFAGNGEVAAVDETGRATCRACGRKIAKGAIGLVTYYDFGGGGLAGDPYTSVAVHLHQECPASPDNETTKEDIG